MSFLDIVRSRRSVRGYSDTPVEQEKLEYILEAARLAPSAVNYQPWSFFVVKSKDVLNKIYESYDREWFRSAPLCVVVCGHHDVSWKRKFDEKDHCDIDVAIATEHMVLAVEELGLGCCWICNFDPELCRKALKIEDKNVEPMVLLPIGYALKSDNTEKKRKETEEIVTVI